MCVSEAYPLRPACASLSTCAAVVIESTCSAFSILTSTTKHLQANPSAGPDNMNRGERSHAVLLPFGHPAASEGPGRQVDGDRWPEAAHGPAPQGAMAAPGQWDTSKRGREGERERERERERQRDRETERESTDVIRMGASWLPRRQVCQRCSNAPRAFLSKEKKGKERKTDQPTPRPGPPQGTRPGVGGG